MTTNIPLLITSPRSGSQFICTVLKYFGARPNWAMRPHIYKDESYRLEYEKAIRDKCYPLVAHLAENNAKNTKYHLERYPNSKLIVLLRQDTLRQAYSLWLSKVKKGQGHISAKNLYDTIEVPGLTEEIAKKIYRQSQKFIAIMERLNNQLEDVGIPHMTLFYEFDLLGKEQCCLKNLVQRMHYFWDIPFFEESMLKRDYFTSVKHRKTNLKTEITYKKLLEMVGKYA